MKKKTVIVSVIVAAVILVGAVATTLTVLLTRKTPEPIITYPTELKVNLLSSAYGVDKNDLRFSWAMNDPKKEQEQKAYRMVFSSSLQNFEKGEYVYDTKRVESSLSAAVTVEGLSSVLEEGKLYYWAVSNENSSGEDGGFSKPSAFVTAKSNFGGDGIWAASSSGKKANDDFAFLRSEFTLSKDEYKNLDKAVVSLTARSPEPSRQFVYNLYINGESLGAGPSRLNKNEKGETELYYDNREVSSAIKEGENAIGVICYTLGDKAFYGELTAYFKDGTSKVLCSASEKESWKSLPGDKACDKSNSIGTFYFTAHANNINSEYYPFGFSESEFDDSTWNAVASAGEIARGVKLVPAETEPVERFLSPADQMTFTEKGNSVVVDLGYEIIGGLHLSLDVPFDAEVTVRYGEQLEKDGSVKWKMLTGNEYTATFKLSAGKYEFDTIDLMTFRYVEFIDMPTILDSSSVRGLELRSAFDEEKSEFSSDNELLNEIYKLVKHTAKATTQDLFVDSQSRERRAYEGDCVINQPLLYAFSDNFAVSRFSAEYLYQNRTWPADYVLYCARMAYADYLYTGDKTSLESYYDILKTKTFTRYFDSSVNMLTAGGITQSSVENCILVDWPETERDGYDMSVKYNTVLNSLAVQSYDNLAKIAFVLGKTDDEQSFKDYAAKIRAAMVEKLYDPTTGAFSDGLYSSGKASSHRSQHATAFALSANLVSGEKAALSASYISSQGKIKTSVYGTFFLFEGLYNADMGDVANALLLDDDESEGARTWAYMINKLGATVTTEAWNAVNKDNMTFSHPWGASPAYAITNGIFGINPTSAAFATFDIKFQTGVLKKANISVPSIKGKISASFDFSSGSVYSVTIPANTKASVYVKAESGKSVYVDGEKANADNVSGYFKVVLGSGKRNIEVR